MPKFSVILAAAGRSSRFQNPAVRKPLVLLRQKPIWWYSVELFRARSDVHQLIAVVAPDDIDEFRLQVSRFSATIKIDVVSGGNERADSVANGLALVHASCDFVAIHDAARPCIDANLIERVFVAAVRTGAAIPAIPVHSTIKRSADGRLIEGTVDRTGLYLAQTPQVFRREIVCDLYSNRGGYNATDESQLAERQGIEVALVEGSPLNLKITTPQDLALATACLDVLPTPRFDAPIDPRSESTLRR